MELVEGEDLSAHIARGPIAWAEALPIAKQIADALEAAHEQGIIHRDLKPANIKVRADGTVKVLDFGLAKALGPEGASGTADAMNSPTLTARATQVGVILGTAAYMAPEQARGRAVDKRADIWAFGVVLYEMLTGRRAFDGDDISITLANVLKDDVSWQALPADLPVPLRRLLRRCLEKDPRRRLSAIGDARLELDEALSPVDRDGSGAAGEASVHAPAAVVIPVWRSALPWAIACAFGVALVSGLVVWAPWRATPAPAPRHLLANIGVDASLVTDRGAAAILSPDGTTLAFSARQDSQSRLFLRKLDRLQATPLAGTEGAVYPFFSPNGLWVGFFAGTKLKKVSIAGGAPIALCDVVSGRGGTWTEDDLIIFSPAGADNAALLQVPATGGQPMPFGTLGKGAVTQRWPQALPGGKAIVYTEHSSLLGFETANIVVATVPADTSAKAGPAKVVVPSAYYGRYVPSGLTSPNRREREGGHLLYVQQGTLFAVPFDPIRLETVGPAAPAIQGFASSTNSGGAQVDVSAEGTLAYVPGGVTSNLAVTAMDWITRDGQTSVLRATKSLWANPRFSPDGQKVAMNISDGQQNDIWVYDWARDTLTQLTFDAAADTNPLWTLDGKRIVFTSNRSGPGSGRNLYWVSADGTGEVTRLTDSPTNQFPSSWHPSGRFLAFTENHAGTGWDVMILPMEGDATKGWTAGTPTLFVGTPAVESDAAFSPDGRFVAYSSAPDVYVRPFPGPGGPWRVSTNGGRHPRWSASTRELRFVAPGSVASSGAALTQVWFAPFSVAGDAFVPGKPQLWSPTNIVWIGADSQYDLHPDGRRVAAAVDVSQTQTTVQDHVVVMSHFFNYLRTIAPVKK
jgi:serine/threonine-protein kinase